MAKVTILITEEKIKLVGAYQCANGKSWDAENCFEYCNSGEEIYDKNQADKLECSATTLALSGGCGKPSWYREKGNFVDAEVNVEVDQTFRDILIEKLMENNGIKA